MRVTMEFIDHKGFWHIYQAASKALAKQSLNQLHPDTEIYWKRPNYVMVSQQYIKR